MLNCENGVGIKSFRIAFCDICASGSCRYKHSRWENIHLDDLLTKALGLMGV